MTIERAPDIQRQQTAVQFGDGVVQEQAGLFDLTLLSTLGYEHRVQELTEARKQTERDKRDNLAKFLSQNKVPTDQARRLLPAIDQVRASNGSAASIQALDAIDPSLSSLLRLYDSLIAAQAANPAVANDLRAQRTNFINTTLGDFRRSLQDQIFGYDDTERRLANLGAAPDDEVFYRASFDIEFAKRFRNGIQVGPYLDGSYEGTNFKGKPRSEEFGGKGLEDLFTFHAGTGFLIPLKRGRGSQIVAAGERAAVRERDAARAAAEHQAAVSALSTIEAYWDVRAAQENVETIQRMVGIQAKLVQLTQQIITAGDLPRIELSRAQAAQARAQAQLADAGRQLHQARVTLAEAIGVGVTDDDATIPKARDEFPAVPAAGAPSAATLVPGAIQQRRDVAAAAEREAASRVLETAAAANTGMLVDLSGSTFYTALEERTIQRAIDRWVGPSVTFQLNMEKPLGNNQLQGQLVQRTADARLRQIDAVDLQRQIGLRVVQATGSMSDTIARIRQAEASVGFYNDIAQAEITRFTAGDATLIDTVLVQQQQTEAMLALTAARRDLGRLIAQLRFESGTLLPAGAVAEPNLKTLPPGGGTGGQR
jgi:outer membrane protein